MSEAPMYLIQTVNDFMRVPEDRLADCLVEFAECIDLVRAMSNIIRITAEAKGVTLPENFTSFPQFQWVDDGKRRLHLHVTEEPTHERREEVRPH